MRHRHAVATHQQKPVGDGLTRRDGMDARAEEAIHILGANLKPGIVPEEMKASGEAADDNDVLAEVLWHRCGELFQDRAWSHQLDVFLAHHWLPLASVKA